jgi:Ran GTPase-activating protein (RanGAP) involved in mRNA processing and transport
MLGLTDCGDKGVEEIIKSGVLKRLKSLDLQAGCISDEGAERLAKCPELKNLERLDLSKNAISKDGEKLLKATKVNVDVSGQHGEADPMGGDDWAEYFFTEGDIE